MNTQIDPNFTTVKFGSEYDLQIPKYKSQLRMCDLELNFTSPMPNWFWRTMQYLLLGFKWKETK